MRNKKRFETVLTSQLCWIALLFGLACALILPVIAATDSGEFKVGDGVNPAADSDGATFSVVVWEDDDGDSTGITGLRLDQLGDPLGNEFQINPAITGTQRNPDVAVLPTGDIVVVWENEDASGTTILGRRFADTGLPTGIEFSVQPVGTAMAPAIESDAQGNFVIAWTGSLSRRGHKKFRHFARRFDSQANPLEPPQVFGRKGPPTSPTLAVQPTGEYLVAWESNNKNIRAIVLDRFSSQVSSIFRVNRPGGKHSVPSAGVAANGDFTIAWRKTQGRRRGSVRVRGVTDIGIPSGVEFQANLSSVDRTVQPTITTDEAYNTVVVWQSKANPLGQNAIFTRLLDQGIPSGVEFQVNPVSNGLAGNLDVTPEAPYNFLVVWENQEPTSSVEDMDILANCFEVVPE